MFILRNDGELSLEGKVVKIRPCFPGKYIDKYLSIRDEDDNEVSFIEDVKSLEEKEQEIILDILMESKRKLELKNVIKVEEEVELRIFEVETNSGKTIFYTRLEDWPKKLSDTLYLITDIHEDDYLVNLEKLDRRSKKLLSGLVD